MAPKKDRLLTGSNGPSSATSYLFPNDGEFRRDESYDGHREQRCPKPKPLRTLGFWIVHFPFAFSLLIRDWMAPTVRFIFRAIAGAFIPEASSLRNISSNWIRLAV
jgi:hypothetical protein